MNKYLFLMMGAPGSGKSTWLKKNATRATDKIVSRDAIRFAKLQPGDNYFEHEDEVYQEFVDTIQKYLDDEETKRVFADASHLNARARNKLLNLLCLFNTEVCVIWLNTSLKTCIERNNNREGRANVPESTIKSMWQSQKRPKADEVYIKRCYIVNEDTQRIDILLINTKDENDFEF